MGEQGADSHGLAQLLPLGLGQGDSRGCPPQGWAEPWADTGSEQVLLQRNQAVLGHSGPLPGALL